MSDRVFTLLVLFLILQDVCVGFQVWTLLQNSYYDNSTVNIICQHNAQNDWTVRASVSINDQKVCSTDQNDTACEGRREGNQFNFTLKLTAEQKGRPCQCMVYRSAPIPVLMRKGEKMTLYPGCDIPPGMHTDQGTTKNMDEIYDSPLSPLAGLLTWVLLGIVLLLCFYSLIITVVYIKLRIQISEELKLTYVPMQKNPGRPNKKVKGGDKNAEYMDMREVQRVQSIRDMNHNSRLTPVGAVV